MKLGAFEVNEPLPKLKEVHALASLEPWVNVGNVGTLTLSWLEKQVTVKELARLARPGDFFDFTRYRPTSYMEEGLRRLTIPNTYINFGTQEAGNDFLFLHLLEPHSHGEVYVDSILQVLAKFNITRYCLIGSMYDYVPHTRPLPVTGGSSKQALEPELAKMKLESSSYQGPTTILSLISQSAPSMGIDTMSLLVHLPQYTQMDDDYTGAVRLMEILGSVYHFPADAAYIEMAKQQLAQIDAAIEKNPQLKGVVEQLEGYYESRTERKEKEMPRLSPEIEKFLSEMDKRFREG